MYQRLPPSRELSHSGETQEESLRSGCASHDKQQPIKSGGLYLETGYKQRIAEQACPFMQNMTTFLVHFE